MSLGWLLALLVLVASVIAVVFSAATPAQLPWVLFAMLAIAILVSDVVFPWRRTPP